MISLDSVKRFCKDELNRIENYEKAVNDKENMWVCHHRLELTLDNEMAHTSEDLRRLGMYYNRPYFELIFLPRNTHAKLHYNTLSNEKRQKCNVNGAKGKSWSVFGQKFIEHYGKIEENYKIYHKEYSFYRKHHRFSWE